jgi:hypothetical protein
MCSAIRWCVVNSSRKLLSLLQFSYRPCDIQLTHLNNVFVANTTSSSVAQLPERCSTPTTASSATCLRRAMVILPCTRLNSGHDLTKWEKILKALKSGEMPKEDEPQPNKADLMVVAKWIEPGLCRYVEYDRAGRTHHHYPAPDQLRISKHDPGFDVRNPPNINLTRRSYPHTS